MQRALSAGCYTDRPMTVDFDWNDAYAGDGSDPVVADHRLLSAAPSLPGRALDLGCGTGGTAVALAETGWEVTGVDVASRAIASARIAARRRGVAVDFVVADITTWVPPSQYDLILSAFALPRRDQGREAALRMAINALAAGGTIIIAELDASMTRVFGTEADFIDIGEMRRYLHGLEIVSVERTQVPHSHDGDTPHGDGRAAHLAVTGIARRPCHPGDAHD